MEDWKTLKNRIRKGLRVKKRKVLVVRRIGTSSRGDNFGNLGAIRPGGSQISREEVYWQLGG